MKRTIIINGPNAGKTVGEVEGVTAAAASAAAVEKSGVIRAVVSLGCAFMADGLQWLLPFSWVVCDGAMVIALLLIWGWRWEILVAVVPELIPGMDLFPTWTLFAGYLIATRRNKPAA